MAYCPIIIIGAPRSGTNMLRDALVKLSGVSTWPCDEINYIWRHGNVRYPSDELLPEMATTRQRNYVRRQFDWVAETYNANYVVEKTCANSLRVGFVDRIIPDAKYLFIKRNGFDVIASAMKRWKAKLDLGYIAKKARFVPKSDLPYYAFSYLKNRVHRAFSADRRLAYWGPKLNNMDTLCLNHSLEQICGIQWQRCLESANFMLGNIPSEKVLKIDYEKFVESPTDNISQVATFLDLDANAGDLRSTVTQVNSNSIGKHRQELTNEQIESINSVIGSTLRRYHYD